MDFDEDDRDELDRYIEESIERGQRTPGDETSPTALADEEGDTRETLGEVDRAIDSFAREETPPAVPAGRDDGVIRLSEPLEIAAGERPPASDGARAAASQTIQDAGADRAVDQLAQIDLGTAPELPRASDVIAEVSGSSQPSPPAAPPSQMARVDAQQPPQPLAPSAPPQPLAPTPEDRAVDSLATDEPADAGGPPEAPGAAPTAAEDAGAEDAALASLAGREPPPKLPSGSVPEGPMIPSEGDIEGARMRDIFLRGPLEALGGLFAGFTGRRASPRASEEARLIERRNRMLGEKREALGAQERQRAATAQEERAARTEEREGRRLSLQEQQAAQESERRAGDSDLRRQLAQPQLDRAAREAASFAELEDETTEASRSWQTQLRTRLAGLPPSQRDPILRELGGNEGIAQMSGNEVRRYVESRGMLPESPRMRGTAGAAGGGGAAADARRRGTVAVGQTDVQRFVDAGLITEEAATGLVEQMKSGDRRTRDAAQQEINRLNARMPESGATRVLIPGVRAGSQVDDVQARAYTNTLMHTRGALDALQTYEDVFNRYGRLGPLSPSARAEMESAHDKLVAMVAQIRNTGVISPTEMPTIDEALPNPTSFTQAILGTFPARLRAYRESLERNVTTVMEGAGVDEAGQATALDYVRSRRRGGAAQAGEAAPEGAAEETSQEPAADPRDLVVMRMPNRTLARVPRAQVQRRIAQGWTEVPNAGTR